MSSNKIELTDDAVSRIARAMDGSFSAGFDGPDLVCGQVVKKAILRAVVKAINADAAPGDDPIGTVRRSVAGAVSVHIGGLKPDAWRTTYTDGETKWTPAPKDWAVIYTPQES